MYYHSIDESIMSLDPGDDVVYLFVCLEKKNYFTRYVIANAICSVVFDLSMF